VKISMRYYQPPAPFLRQFAACRQHDTFARLHRITQPTLVLTGDDDPLVPPGNSLLLKERVPHARLEFFPTGRHCFFIEFADAFNKKVINYLGEGIRKPAAHG
jgi:pimeloyl-ACP methyl ester carboxylesterase